MYPYHHCLLGLRIHLSRDSDVQKQTIFLSYEAVNWLEILKKDTKKTGNICVGLIELKVQQIQNHGKNFYMGPANRNKTITDSCE